MIINHLKNNTIMKKKYSKPETYYEGMEPEMMIALSLKDEAANDSVVLSREDRIWEDDDEEEENW